MPPFLVQALTHPLPNYERPKWGSLTRRLVTMPSLPYGNDKQAWAEYYRKTEWARTVSNLVDTLIYTPLMGGVWAIQRHSYLPVSRHAGFRAGWIDYRLLTQRWIRGSACFFSACTIYALTDFYFSQRWGKTGMVGGGLRDRPAGHPPTNKVKDEVTDYPAALNLFFNQEHTKDIAWNPWHIIPSAYLATLPVYLLAYNPTKKATWRYWGLYGHALTAMMLLGEYNRWDATFNATRGNVVTTVRPDSINPMMEDEMRGRMKHISINPYWYHKLEQTPVREPVGSHMGRYPNPLYTEP